MPHPDVLAFWRERHLRPGHLRDADGPDLTAMNDRDFVPDAYLRIGADDADGKNVALWLEIFNLDAVRTGISQRLASIERQREKPPFPRQRRDLRFIAERDNQVLPLAHIAAVKNRLPDSPELE